MRKSENIYVRADKSKNKYKISPNEYELILNNNVPNSYKIDHNNTLALFNSDKAKFTSKLQTKDRIGKLKEKNALTFYLRNISRTSKTGNRPN